MTGCKSTDLTSSGVQRLHRPPDWVACASPTPPFRLHEAPHASWYAYACVCMRVSISVRLQSHTHTSAGWVASREKIAHPKIDRDKPPWPLLAAVGAQGCIAPCYIDDGSGSRWAAGRQAVGPGTWAGPSSAVCPGSTPPGCSELGAHHLQDRPGPSHSRPAKPKLIPQAVSLWGPGRDAGGLMHSLRIM